MSPTSEPQLRELDHRSGDGLEVRLLWHSSTDRVYVTVDDHRYGESFQVEVDSGEALEAFHHPFAYAGVSYDIRSLSVT